MSIMQITIAVTRINVIRCWCREYENEAGKLLLALKGVILLHCGAADR